jgi:trigger factor
LRDYKAPSPISLKPDKRTVTDEQLNRGLEVLREQQARLEATAPGHAIVDGDYIVLDMQGTLDGAPLEGTKKEGQLHKVGSHASVLGLEIDSHVGGKKEGDALEISQPYPSSHPDLRVAGKTVVFTLTIKSVKEKKLPALDDEFAKDCGPYSSLQEIKDKLREGMEQGLKREIEDTYKDTIVKRLMDTHHFDLPETLVERELEAIIRQYAQQQQRKDGAQESSGTEELASLRQEHRDEAARRVKVSLVLETIAEKEGLTVTQDDFNTEIVRLASELKMPAADLVKMIKSGGQESIDDLRTRILVDKALDFVYRNAVIQG